MRLEQLKSPFLSLSHTERLDLVRAVRKSREGRSEGIILAKQLSLHEDEATPDEEEEKDA